VPLTAGAATRPAPVRQGWGRHRAGRAARVDVSNAWGVLDQDERYVHAVALRR